MSFKIIFELILAIIIILAGSTWWPLLKRDKFFKRLIQDEVALSKLLNIELLESFTAKRQQSIPFDYASYADSISIWEQSDKKSMRLLNILIFLIIVSAIIASLKLSISIFIINIVIFLLTRLVPLGESGGKNVLNHMALLASIIYEWRKHNEKECRQWFQENKTLQKVYRAVESLTPLKKAKTTISSLGD
jgi:hypothetical protein